MYQQKLEFMEKHQVNIPFSKEEMKALPKGFTNTSVRDNIGARPTNKFIPIHENTIKYHLKPKVVRAMMGFLPK